jgi:hypothetical protein
MTKRKKPNLNTIQPEAPRVRPKLATREEGPEAMAVRRQYARRMPPNMEEVMARVRQIIDESLAQGPKDAAQLRLAVICQLARDLDPQEPLRANDPSVQAYNARVEADGTFATPRRATEETRPTCPPYRTPET